MVDANHSETGTQAIQRALAVLNCFTRDIDALSLTEISKLVHIPYSTASRITGILEQESFLIRDKRSKLYSLGRRVYGLGYCAKQNDFLRKVIYPYLQKLRDTYGETACIYVREGNYRICFEKASAFHNFKYSPTVGSKYVLWAGAGGRGFLAFSDPRELEGQIMDAKRLTAYTNVDKKRIMKELHSLCKNGYVYCINEYQEGFSSIAGLVVDGTNNILCTIAVTGPSTRFTPEVVKGLTKEIPNFCMEISATFGWKKPDDGLGLIFETPSLDYIIKNMD